MKSYGSPVIYILLVMIACRMVINLLPTDRWIGRLGKYKGMWAAIIVSYYSALILVELLTYIPHINTWVNSSLTYFIIKRFDILHPIKSIAGFALVECVPWMIVGAVIFLFLQAPGGHPALRIILAWMVIRPLYVMVLLRLGLSDGSIVSYVTFYNEFDQHARLLFSGPFAPLASMIGGTLFMFCFGLLCICIWKVIDLSSAGLFSNIRLSNHPPRWLHWRLLAGFYYLSMWCWSLTKVSQASGNDGFMFWTAHKWKGTILVSLRLIVISAATFIMAKYCGKRWIGWRLTKKALLEGFCGLLWSFWLTLGMVLLFRASGRWSSAQWKAPTGDELWYALLMMLQVIVFVLIFQYATVQLLLCRLTFTNAAWFISLVCGFTLAASTGGSWRSFVFFTLFNLLGCYMYLATRSLWLPVAFESGWVFFQGICFGLPSACTRLLGGPEKMSVAPPGKVWLFGSQWGIEGGMLSISTLVFAFLTYRFVRTQVLQLNSDGSFRAPGVATLGMAANR